MSSIASCSNSLLGMSGYAERRQSSEPILLQVGRPNIYAEVQSS